MGTAVLVRHAQASFLTEDYDQLSALGEAQARALGRSWAEAGQRFDVVYSGPRRRQRDTARLVCEALDGPEPVVLDALDEYQAEDLLKAEIPRLASEDHQVARLLGDFQAAEGKPERTRSFERLLQYVMRMWAAAQLGSPHVETWQEFDARVRRALLAISGHRGGRVLAVSSGGTIGAMVGQVVGASHATALDFGWALHNSSRTELLFSESRITLSRFNVLCHLPRRDQHTFR